MNQEINSIEESLKTCDEPVTLASYLTRLAAWNSYYLEKAKDIQLVKPGQWLEIQSLEWVKTGIEGQLSHENREKPLSDKKTEMLWATTPEGQQEIELTTLLKRCEILSRSINKRLYSIEKDYQQTRSKFI